MVVQTVQERFQHIIGAAGEGIGADQLHTDGVGAETGKGGTAEGVGIAFLSLRHEQNGVGLAVAGHLIGLAAAVILLLPGNPGSDILLCVRFRPAFLGHDVDLGVEKYRGFALCIGKIPLVTVGPGGVVHTAQAQGVSTFPEEEALRTLGCQEGGDDRPIPRPVGGAGSACAAGVLLGFLI